MNDHLVLALDVGGSSIKSTLVANGRQIVGQVRVDKVQSAASAPKILHRLAAILSSNLENANHVQQIAFAFPGPFDYKQGIFKFYGLFSQTN